MILFTRYYDQPMIMKRAIDLALPRKITHRVALFYVHGGGWCGGSRDQYHYHLSHFAGKGFLCASAGYRLAPQVSFSEQMADVITGYDMFLSYIKESRSDIRAVIAAGSSAGAHLASLLSLTRPEYFAREAKLRNPWVRPAACVAICAPGTVQYVPKMNEGIKSALEKILRAKCVAGSKVFTDVSPITHVDRQSPDFLFILAKDDPLFPHRDVRAMAKKLRANGKRAEMSVYPAEHGFFYQLSAPVQKKALAVMERFVASVEKQSRG